MFQRKTIVSDVKDLVTSIGEAIDRNVTTDQERMKLYNELQTIVNQYQQQLSERLAADMSSDSWLAKNVRPLTLIALLGLYIIFATFDAFAIMSVSQGYLNILEELSMLVMAFYFGSRGVEKVARSLYSKEK